MRDVDHTIAEERPRLRNLQRHEDKQKRPKQTESNRPTFIYLTPRDQEELADHLPIVTLLPWNHFGRKNVGYLYAMMHGAEVIWDFDDDNGLLAAIQADGKVHMSIDGFQMVPATTPSATGSGGAGRRIQGKREENASETDEYLATRKKRFIKTKQSRRELHKVVDTHEFPASATIRRVKRGALGVNQTSFNPYPIMGAPYLPSWPRGLPLTDIKGNKQSKRDWSEVSKIPKERIGIIQSLANIDPDMDAIYRLTMPIPFDFPSGKKKEKGTTGEDGGGAEDSSFPVAVPNGMYSPYNAQATLHLYSSLWSLLLPITVHGRVSDIWRGYFMQRVARELDILLLFSPPLVEQDRNAHNYLADFQSEEPLYTKANKLVEQLQGFEFGFDGDNGSGITGQSKHSNNDDGTYPSATKSVPGLVEHLWVVMYERGYIEMHDVRLVQAWLQSLIVVGYQFPSIKHGAKRGE